MSVEENGWVFGSVHKKNGIKKYIQVYILKSTFIHIFLKKAVNIISRLLFPVYFITDKASSKSIFEKNKSTFEAFVKKKKYKCSA